MKSPFSKTKPAPAVVVPPKVVTRVQPAPPVDPNAPKGRPTPKRRDAQPRRSGPVPSPPTSGKEARARLKETNKKHREDIKAGRAIKEPPAMSRRDAGPERKLIRDIVDSKRSFASMFPLFAIVLLVFYFVGLQSKNPQLYNIFSYIWLAVFIAIIVEAIFLGRVVGRRIKAAFPKTKERGGGLKFYAVMRSLMFRKGRYPKPEVNVGDPV